MTSMTSLLTLERLKQVIVYDPETGAMRHKGRQGVRDGSSAGALDAEGYLVVRIDAIKHRANRLAWLYMTGKQPEGQIDHINGIRSDDRFCNLRMVSNKQNGRNQRKQSGNKSGVTGVCWHKRYSKWIAQIRVDGKYIYLGMFSSIEAAAAARKAAEVEHGFHENHGRTSAQYRHL